MASLIDLVESVDGLRSILNRHGNASWQRLLEGAPLGCNEVRELGVDRRLVSEGRPCDMEKVVGLVQQSPGRVLLLNAAAGEGKSTYLLQLGMRLEEAHVPAATTYLEGPLDIERISAAMESHGIHHLAILMELNGEVDACIDDIRTVARAAEQLRPEHGIVLVVAARPNVCYQLRSKVRALSELRFAPVDREDATRFADAIRKAAENFQGDSHRFANLASYLELDVDQQVEVFLKGDCSILASFLRATYGEAFTERIKEQFDSYGSEARSVYAHLCVSSVAGRRTESGDHLRLLTGLAELPGDATALTWIDENDIDRWITPHAEVANALLNESPGVLGTTLHHRVRAFLAEPTEVQSLVDSLLGVVMAAAPTKARMMRQRSVRDSIRRPEEVLTSLVDVVASDNDWAAHKRVIRLLLRLIPKDTHDQTHERFVEAIERLITVAARSSFGHEEMSPDLGTWIDFYRDRISWIRASMAERPDLLRVAARDWLRSWHQSGLADMAGWDSEFFLHSMWVTDFMLKERCSAVGDSQKSAATIEEDSLALMALFRSYQRLRRLTSGRAANREAGRFIGTYIGKFASELLDEERYTQLCRANWDYSCDLGIPDERAGVLVANRLRDLGRSEEARSMLMEIMERRGAATGYALQEAAFEVWSQAPPRATLADFSGKLTPFVHRALSGATPLSFEEGCARLASAMLGIADAKADAERALECFARCDVDNEAASKWLPRRAKDVLSAVAGRTQTSMTRPPDDFY